MQWHENFDKVMLSNGFLINKGNKCVYVKLGKNSCVILCLYVDDILIFRNDIHVINDIKKFLKNNFDMKELAPVDAILRINIVGDGDSTASTQFHYIEKKLKKIQLL